MFPLQQPEGHEAAVQMHWPAVASLLVSHVWPDAHAAQTVPLLPHSPSDSPEGWTHESLSQQPEHKTPPHVQAPFEQA